MIIYSLAYLLRFFFLKGDGIISIFIFFFYSIQIHFIFMKHDRLALGSYLS